MKTAEEILKEYGNWNKEGLAEWHKDYIIAAMEEYAQQQVKNLNIPAVMPSLPSQNEIDAQIDKYAFRVPYDGSNNFYDEVALKHYKAGIEWLLGRIHGNGA